MSQGPSYAQPDAGGTVPPPPDSTRLWSRRALLAAVLAVVLIAAAFFWHRTGVGLEAVRRGASQGTLAQRAASITLAFRWRDLESPGGEGSAEFEVAEAESLASVADRLEADGLIRSADAFLLLAKVRGMDRGVQAGVHAVPRGSAADEVLAALLSAQNPGIRVSIPEGHRAEEVAEILEQAGLPGAAGFLDVARSPTAFRGAEAGVVGQRPSGAGLEGFLFPDTYEVAIDASAEDLAALMTLTFDRRYADLAAQAQEEGITPYEVATLASIVEREAALDNERPRIGRVFRNRLAEPPYLLGADPTVQYALGLQMSPLQWWKRPLTADDLRNPSLYNTYVHPGLPPGPIANPGLAALEGVVAAEPGPWMFFVADEEACDGSHVFAETFEEHLANVARYRTGTCVP